MHGAKNLSKQITKAGKTREKCCLYPSGPTGVSHLEEEVRIWPLSGKDPILEKVSIFEYVLDKSNCRCNNGEMYQFVEKASSPSKPQTQKAGCVEGIYLIPWILFQITPSLWMATYLCLYGGQDTYSGKILFLKVWIFILCELIDTRQRAAIYRV